MTIFVEFAPNFLDSQRLQEPKETEVKDDSDDNDDNEDNEYEAILRSNMARIEAIPSTPALKPASPIKFGTPIPDSIYMFIQCLAMPSARRPNQAVPRRFR